MTFKCERIERLAKDGTLEAVGIRWTEARPYCDAYGCVLGLCGVFLGIAGCLIRGSADTLIFAVLGAGLVWMVVVIPGRSREIVFWRDGRMETELGLSTSFLRPGERWLYHTGIRSIETEQLSRQGHYTHGVRIFYEGGETNHVAQNLKPDHAHMVAVRLTMALRQLRENMAQAARIGQPQRTTRSEEKVID